MGDRVAVMRDGRLQQVDAPTGALRPPCQHSSSPAFIGSPCDEPPANTAQRATATERSRSSSARPCWRCRARCSARRPGLARYVGAEVIVGIRPEDIEDAALVPSANGAALDVRVTLAEALGAEVIAHFPLAGDVEAVAVAAGPESPALEAVEDAGPLLTARLSPRSAARSGQPLRVAIDVERLHFFDPESDEAIW